MSIFKEWLQTELAKTKDNIERFRAVLENEKQKLKILMELQEIGKDKGERAEELIIDYNKLTAELFKKAFDEFMKFMKTVNDRKDDFIPDFYK